MATYTSRASQVDGFPRDDEYLTVAEVADLLKLTPKRIRNLMSAGAFVAGVHFFRRRGIAPRFLRSRVEAWVRGVDDASTTYIPMARDRHRAARHRSGQL